MNYRYEDHRIYVTNQDGKVIVNATFPFIKEGTVVVDHTFVDPSLRGQGVASNLMHEVYQYAKKKGYKMVATCPYAVVWFKKHK
jgi:predicted GNAT family acetyltransferase